MRNNEIQNRMVDCINQQIEAIENDDLQNLDDTFILDKFNKEDLELIRLFIQSF